MHRVLIVWRNVKVAPIAKLFFERQATFLEGIERHGWLLEARVNSPNGNSGSVPALPTTEKIGAATDRETLSPPAAIQI
jgi:hypothetical protein